MVVPSAMGHAADSSTTLVVEMEKDGVSSSKPLVGKDDDPALVNVTVKVKGLKLDLEELTLEFSVAPEQVEALTALFQKGAQTSGEDTEKTADD